MIEGYEVFNSGIDLLKRPKLINARQQEKLTGIMYVIWI